MPCKGGRYCRPPALAASAEVKGTESPCRPRKDGTLPGAATPPTCKRSAQRGRKDAPDPLHQHKRREATHNKAARTPNTRPFFAPWGGAQRGVAGGEWRRPEAAAKGRDGKGAAKRATPSEAPPTSRAPYGQTGSGTKREVKTRPSAHGRARKRTPFHKVFIFSSHNISRYLSLFFTMHRYFVIIPHCDRVGWSLGGFVLHLVQLGKGAGLRHIRRKPCGVKQGGYFLR